MKHGESLRVGRLLEDVPEGSLTIVRDSASGREHILLTDRFSARTSGKGRVEAYGVVPGIDVSYNLICAPEITVHHADSPSVLELFYCRSGRVGWNMRGGTAYLGAGDLSVHSAACCADSAMMFPLGYAEGISVSVDFQALAARCPEILREAGADLSRMQAALCTRTPAAVPACLELEWIFAPLYAVPPERRRPYLELKTQELLLYLMDVRPQAQPMTQYGSEQIQRIRDIHHQLTGHLDRRFTIEELSRQYLINTSSLKEVFKAVYGLPIATYMKEYRVRQAMKMLRETDLTISEIAARVGYETQGKFSQAFRDVARMLPTEYRRTHGSQPAGEAASPP